MAENILMRSNESYSTQDFRQRTQQDQDLNSCCNGIPCFGGELDTEKSMMAYSANEIKQSPHFYQEDDTQNETANQISGNFDDELFDA